MPVSAEAYGWPEGHILVWTGTSNPVTAVLAQQANVQRIRGWANIGPTFDGSYSDVQTGTYANVVIGRAYIYGDDLQGMFESATAVHMEHYHSSINGSAGVKLWSGRIDQFNMQGQAGGVYTIQLTYHANNWSAY
jgi:hypothetical protein